MRRSKKVIHGIYSSCRKWSWTCLPVAREVEEVKGSTEMPSRKIRAMGVRELDTRRLLRALGDLLLERRGALPERIKGVSIDSRDVRPGFLFVAIRGEQKSGEEYVTQAIEKGASCIMIEGRTRPASPNGRSLSSPTRFSAFPFSGDRAIMIVTDAKKAAGIAASAFYGNPTLECPVVAVTGTNGKTTFTYLMEAILREAGLNPGIIGTVNYRMANKSWPSGLTTPDPVTLQRMLREMIEDGADAVVMEASSHALEQKRLWGSRIKCAVFTNMTRDHLDYHKTMDNYFLAKQRLFLDYRPDMSVFNIDDPYGHLLYLRARGKRISYSLIHEATIRPKDLVLDINGIDLVLDLYGKTLHISSRLFGRFNCYNILAALSASFSLGIPSSAIQNGVYQCQNIPGRMERISLDPSIYAFVDYAHTPDAVERVLREVKRLVPKGRVITVVGCGGDRDRGKRPLIGYVSTRLSDLTIFTSDNPRSEDPLNIIDDMLGGVHSDDVPYCLPRLSTFPRKEYRVIVDREEAIRVSVAQARPGDVILVLGKGHEQYQLIDGRKNPFDDRKILKEALEENSLC